MAAGLRTLYSTLWWLALPAVLTRALVRGRRDPRYREHLAERLGRWPGAAPCDLWFHAVSMGEVRALRVLVGLLLESWPALRILMTVTTPTGRAAAEAAYPRSVEVRYLPYDLGALVGSVFATRSPRALVLMEAELWPNLIACANAHDVPVFLINARLSARSARRHRKFAALGRPMFAGISQVLCQSQTDAARFVRLGCREAGVSVVGSLKFDRLSTAPAVDRVCEAERPLRLVLGCLRRGEESIVFDALAALQTRLPGLETVLIPRQVGDAAFFAKALAARGIPVEVVTQADFTKAKAGEVRIVDATGVLDAAYANARAAYVGGALVPLGGHSVADALAVGCPAVTGPFHHNNTVAVEALTAVDALRVVDAPESFADALAPWLAEAGLSAAAGAAGQAALASLAGASAATLAALESAGLLPARESASAGAERSAGAASSV